MKILFDKQIKESLALIHPTKIAVAYIGANWRDFLVSPERIEAVIVSPTLGTNPHAVSEMARFIGWEKIHFLDELHAKLYIGDNAALTGSSNLTSNGLSGSSLLELCVEINSDRGILKLNDFFDNLLQRAQAQYPSRKEKEARLEKLEMLWNKAVSNTVILPPKSSTPSFRDFNLLADDHFYVLYEEYDDPPELSEDAKKIEPMIAEWSFVRGADHAKSHKWILIWRLKDNVPDVDVKIRWMYIHDIIEKAVVENAYPYQKLLFQRVDKPKPQPPFKITRDVDRAFRKALESEDLRKFFIQNNKDDFRLARSTKGTRRLVAAMNKILDH